MALWEEWTPDAGFELVIEVCPKDSRAELADALRTGQLAARLTTELYCQVTVTRGDVVVFNQRVAHDATALRASVTVLARAIAASTWRV
jgi:hypothetical protein